MSFVATSMQALRRSRSSTASASRVAIHRRAFSEGSKSKSDLLHSLSDRSDDEIVDMVERGDLKNHQLESELKQSVQSGGNPDCTRAVRVRRQWLSRRITEMSPTSDSDITELPYDNFDQDKFYQQILGNNCELVIGFVPLPVGVVGPLKLNGESYHVPMATTEGALVASTNRGCRAIGQSGGADVMVFNDGMTRAPVLKMGSAKQCVALKVWLDQPENFAAVKEAFESTSRFAKLLDLKTSVAGRTAHCRFKCSTGDAMGMNMISKAVLAAMEVLKAEFPEIDVLSLSGNVCTDKKPSAINWLEGRGKSVLAEVILPGHVIKNTLKCTVESLIELNVSKNLVGSALAGSIGGNNAHASNVVTAVFLATGQDPAQNVESSNCMTLMEAVNGGEDLHVSVTMPSIEVGTIGGGTSLHAQGACLGMLGLNGSDMENPGAYASQLAMVVAGSVLAGEISLMSALASNHLVSAHMALGRKNGKE